MMNGSLKLGVAAIVFSAIWAFVGVERIVSDHEKGITWELFIKHRPSLQVRFENPARKGLEIEPIENLSPAEQDAFIEFCTVRFGVMDTMQCRALILQNSV